MIVWLQLAVRLVVNDLFYAPGSLFAAVSPGHVMTALSWIGVGQFVLCRLNIWLLFPYGY